MLYDVSLTIDYSYDNRAGTSRHIIRLLPADLPGEQRLIAGTVSATPKADEWINRTDFFGNRLVEVAFFEDHDDISFRAQSRVERYKAMDELEMTPRVSALGRDIATQTDLSVLSPHHFVGPSPRVPLELATTAYALERIKDDPSVLEAVALIGACLHRDLAYDPKATNVETPMLTAFNGRHGVCQDFAHIMIACLRGVGIPSGYVSGFLRTVPPAGKPRLEGADAMHAWVRAWCGVERGWVEYDPTNAVFVDLDHIVIARGRDYFDVAPVKGVLRTSGSHSTKQAVDVVPVV